MSDNVDTRIVEAKFDSEDFEKGVNKTIKKLDELKSKLEMKDTGKSVAELTKKTNEGIEKTNSSLERLSDRLTSFTGMIKQQLLSGLASEVSGAFLQIERSLAGLVNQLGSQQVQVGLSRYTEILNSVRTLTIGGIGMDTAYEEIRRLDTYSDQTNASLEHMVSLMTKLKTSGADLDSARKTVEGFSNAAASLGVNMSYWPALYTNFAQAYGKSKMQLEDWKTFQSFNMVGEKFTQQILDAAVAVGTLTKNEQGLYQTSNKVDKTIKKSQLFSADKWETYLNTGFFNRKVMEKVFGEMYYWEKISQEELDNLTDEEMQEFAYKCFKSGQEARSFTDALNTLKNAISSNWAKTFELLFGTLDKATEFFTWLSDNELVNAIRFIGDFRNEILGIWALGDDGENGRDLLISSLENIDSIIGNIAKAFQNTLPASSDLGGRLWNLSYRFRSLTESMKEWFGEADDEDSRVSKLANVFSKFGKALAAIGEVVTPVVTAAWGSLSGILTAIFPTVDSIADGADHVRLAIENLKIILQPLLDILPTVFSVLGTIGTIFVGSAVDTAVFNIQLISDALGFFIELFGGKSAQQVENGKGILEGIRDDIIGIGNAAQNAMTFVKDFFSNLFKDLRVLLGMSEPVEGEEGGFFKNVTQFFETNEFLTNAKAWIDKAVTDVGTWIKDIPKRLSQYAFNFSEFIHGLFYNKVGDKIVDNKGNLIREEMEIETPLKQWLDKTIERIREFIHSIPTRISELANEVGSVVGVALESIITFFFGEKVQAEAAHKASGKDQETNPETFLRDTVNSQFNKMLGSVKDFIKDIPNRIRKGIKTTGSIISNFWDGLFYTKDTVMETTPYGKRIQKTVKVAKPLKNWLDKALNDAQKFIHDIPSIIKSKINSTGDILRTLVSSLFGKKNGEPVTGADITAALKKPFEDLHFSDVLASIKDIGMTLVNNIVSIFTGTTDVDENSEILATAVANGIAWIRTKAEEAWTSVKTFVETLPQKIAGIFNGERTAEQIKEDSGEKGPIETAIREFGASIGNAIQELPGTLLKFFNNATSEIGKLWDKLYAAVTGKDSDADKANDEQKKKIDYIYSEFDNTIDAKNGLASKHKKADTAKSPIVAFIKDLGESIRNAFASIPTLMAQGLDMAIEGINAAARWIESWFAKENSITEGVEEGLAKSTDKDAKQQSALILAISNICATLKELITSTVPGALTEAFTWVRNNATQWKEDIGKILDDNGINWTTVHEKAANIGTTIGGYIKEIPNYVTAAWNSVKDVLFGKEEILPEIIDTQGNLIRQEMRFRKGGLAVLFGDIFKEVGPAVVDVFNKAITFAGEKIDWVTGLMKDRDKSIGLVDALKEASKESKLAEAVYNLGVSLKNLITKTIPGFLTQAFEEVKVGLPNLLDTLFGSIFGTGGTAEEADKQVKEAGKEFDQTYNALAGELVPSEKAIDNVSTAMQKHQKSLMDFFFSSAFAEEVPAGAEEGIKNFGSMLQTVLDLGKLGDAAKWASIALLVYSIGYVLEEFTDVFEITDELEAVSHGIAFAGVGMMLAGFGMMLGELAILVNDTTEIGKDVNGNSITKFDKMTGTMDKIGKFLLDLATTIAWIVGLWQVGGPIASSIEGLIDLKSGGVASALKVGGGAVIAGGLGFGIGTLLTDIVNNLLSGFGPALQTISTQVQNFTSIISPALQALMTAKDNLALAIEFPGLLRDFVNGFYGLGSEIFESSSETYIEYILGIGTFIQNLASGLSQFETIKDPGNALDNIIALTDPEKENGFGKLISNMHASIVKWATTTYDPNSIRDMGLEFDLLGKALGVFGNNITKLNPNSIEALNTTLDVFNKLAESFKSSDNETIVQLISDSNLSKFGTEIQQFSVNMKFFAENLEGIKADVINENVYESLTKKIDLIGYVIQTFIGTAQGIFVGLPSETLNLLNDLLPTMSTSLITFVNDLNTQLPADINLDRLTALKTAMDVFNSLVASVFYLDQTNVDKGLKSMSEFIYKFSSTIYDVPTLDNQFSNSDLLKRLIGGINREFANNGEVIQPSITPVINTESLTAQLNEYFASQTFHVNLQASVDAAIAAGQLTLNIPDHDYTGQLNGIQSSISSLSGDILSLGDSISRMNIVVNGNGGSGESTYNAFHDSRRNTSIVYGP